MAARKKKAPTRSPKKTPRRRKPADVEQRAADRRSRRDEIYGAELPTRKPGPGTTGGRPRFVFDQSALETIQLLARARNTVEDMARILGISKSTLEKRIRNDPDVGDAYHLGCADRSNAIRTAQFRYAMRGNPRLLIWLGMNDLGQRATRAVEVSGPGGGPLQIENELLPELIERLTKFVARPKRSAA